jgi:hypothetical protein
MKKCETMPFRNVANRLYRNTNILKYFMSSQRSTLSVWKQEIQINVVPAIKTIVFKSHATVNAREVMRYSMIAQKVTDGCYLF